MLCLPYWHSTALALVRSDLPPLVSGQSILQCHRALQGGVFKYEEDSASRTNVVCSTAHLSRDKNHGPAVALFPYSFHSLSRIFFFFFFLAKAESILCIREPTVSAVVSCTLTGQSAGLNRNSLVSILSARLFGKHRLPTRPHSLYSLANITYRYNPYPRRRPEGV